VENRHCLCVLSIALCCLLLTACNKQNSGYQGYIEGRYTYIAASFPGILQTLTVKRGMTVQKNQALFTLEQEPELSSYNAAQAELSAAQAKVAEAQATLKLAQIAFARRQILLQQGHIEQETLDKAQQDFDLQQAELKAAEENVTALKAKLVQSQWSLQKKTLAAPKAGYILDTYFLPGELVPANKPILAILSPQDINVIFFVGETDLSKLQLGQQIGMTCDSCGNNLTAKVSYISPKAEFTPPIIYSDERRTKLVYRIEAELNNTATALHPGQPVKIQMN
jgi:HlyD family secretion protein